MKTERRRPGNLKVTENCFLDMSRVLQFYILSRNEQPIDPITALRDPFNGAEYAVNGHHRGFGIELDNKEVDVQFLESDLDVLHSKLGKAKYYDDLSSLLQACRSSHQSGRDELGLEDLTDYKTLQRTYSFDTSKPIIQIVTLNPSVDHHQEEDIYVPGGKGLTIARDLHELGYDYQCIYALAGGSNGRRLASEINDRNIAFSVVPILDNTLEVTLSGRRTISPEHEYPKVRQTELSELLDRLERGVHKGDYLVLAGSVPQGISPTIFKDLIEKYKESATTFCDTGEHQPFELALQAQPHLLRVNCDNIYSHTGVEYASNAELIEAASKIADEHDIKGLFITLDEAGTAIIIGDKMHYGYLPDAKTKNEIGRGEALIAGYLSQTANGADPLNAFKFAVAAEYSHRMHTGNTGAKKEETLEYLKDIHIESYNR
ncbi:hypothetical protein H6504_00180 [Candidatus Woesearchaeota archaeon]|nr:hypothetical protein [Candidatus Woesearchaeota archaeon]